MNGLSGEQLSSPGFFPAVVSYYKSKWENYRTPCHAHDRLEIMYVTEGHCTVTAEDQPVIINPFSYILLDADTPHDLCISSTCAVLNVEIIFRSGPFPGMDLAALAEQEPAVRHLSEADRPYYLIKDDGTVLRTLLNLYEVLDVNRPENPETLLLLDYLLIRLAKAVRGITQSPSSNYSYVENACRYIRNHMDEAIKVSDIAESVHINSAYLQRLFKKIKGQTLVSYINQQRIILACNMLARTDLDISDLALSLGFSSQQYFSYLFKQYIGVSPRQYRRTHSSAANHLNRIVYIDRRDHLDDLMELNFSVQPQERKRGRPGSDKKEP